jgi:hypothetical protein
MPAWITNENTGDNTVLVKYLNQVNKRRKFKNGNCEKTAPKAKATPKKVTAPAKVVKPVAKAAVKKLPFQRQPRP